ncbi:MAG: sensor histidine kinase [Thermoproteota archaeon]
MGKTKFSKNSIALLALTAAIALSLSIVSFQYSSFTSSEILKIAAEDIRSNARIQAHDLENVFVNRIESVSANLQIISSARSLQNSEFERAQTLFNAAQNSTSDLTNFYMWLDRDGKMVWLSNINQTAFEQFRGTDLSQRSYFIESENRLDSYYSSAMDSNDNVTRIYISHPIISAENGEFLGVSVAGIRLDTFGSFLQEQLSHDTQSSIGMIDRRGMILYSNSEELIGKDVFGPELQARLPPELENSFLEFIRRSLQGESGLQDFSAGSATATIAYEPIIIRGEQFGTLYIITPHQFASNVSLLVDQQRNFSTILTIVIGAAAVGVAALVLVWNTRLTQTVDARTTELRSKTEELKRSNDSLAAANEQLKIHDRMQKEFINVAAHELRTPTQAILGYAELLQMDPDERDEMIRAIHRNSIRLQRLTSDILDVTRIESEALKLDKEKFNLKDVVEGAVQDAKNQRADAKVKFVYEPKDIFVEADRGRITQVLANLLDNATKFTKEGIITISTDKKDGQALINVKDSGTGIDPDIMPRLFSKFATKSDKGTGLGLFISRSIIEAHDGGIWCSNNSGGKGATFAFSLPAIEP